MVINHNISALNTFNQLSKNENATAKSLQKLSSGLRINSAADDAAGLAISQKMTAQVNGLDQASSNAQNGISLVQTAEGALNETHSILQRMRELAVQSANDTNQDADRSEIQAEVDQLAQEITEISNDTEFNSQKLLDGSITDSGVGQSYFQVGANAGQTLEVSIGAMDAKTLGVSRDVAATQTVSGTSLAGATVTVAEGKPAASLDDTISVTFNGSDTVTLSDAKGNTDAITVADDTATSIVGSTGKAFEGLSISLGSGKTVANLQTGTNTVTLTAAKNSAAATFADGAKTSDATAAAGIDVSSRTTASDAITTIDTAIKAVSDQRSQLGAYQNRLEHTINNLTVESQNLTSASSAITDVDMAKEMMSYSKYNILNQAATAMLAQANQLPSGILNLLK